MEARGTGVGGAGLLAPCGPSPIAWLGKPCVTMCPSLPTGAGQGAAVPAALVVSAAVQVGAAGRAGGS
jgi:hypothetical protein